MEKLVYLSFGNAGTPGRGVSKKIDGQLKAFQRAGMETTFVSGYNDKLAVYTGTQASEPELLDVPGGTRAQLAKWVDRHAKEFTYAYIRFQFFDLFFKRMLQNLKKQGVRIVVEIPTYPYTEEVKAQGAKGVPKRIVDALFRAGCVRLVDGFTAPVYEGEILGKPGILMRNGIDLDRVQPRTPQEPEGQINLLAVASMSPWHGFERLLNGLHAYQMSDGIRKILLNVVGEGPELGRYQALTKELGLEEQVKFWGRLSGDALERMYDISEVGICSLGVHNFNVAKTNTLKTLEYLAKGMPIVCEQNEAGVALDNQFRLNVPFDNTPIDMKALVHFYDTIYRERTKQQVIEAVRSMCQAECSADAAMKDVIRFLQQT